MSIDDWIAELAGKILGRDLNLKEGSMDTKPWYQSKTIWSDILTIVMGVWATATPVLATHGINLPAIPSWILTFLGALGIYGRVTATKTIG